MAMKLPDELQREIKRIAFEHSRLVYEQKRDELMRRATALVREGEDVQAMLAEEWRESMRSQLRSTQAAARARDMPPEPFLLVAR